MSASVADLEEWLPGFVASEWRRLQDEAAEAHEYLSRIERDGEDVPGDREYGQAWYARVVEEIRGHQQFADWAAIWLTGQFSKKLARMRWW